MTQVAEEHYLSDFSRIEKTIEDSGGTKRMWLDQMRKAAIDRFKEVGFPTGKDEEWRLTSVAPLAKGPFKPAPFVELHGDDISAHTFGHAAAAELVFVNGHFSPKLSVTRDIPRGVKLSSLAHAIETDSDLVERHLGKYADITVNPFV